MSCIDRMWDLQKHGSGVSGHDWRNDNTARHCGGIFSKARSREWPRGGPERRSRLQREVEFDANTSRIGRELRLSH